MKLDSGSLSGVLDAIEGWPVGFTPISIDAATTTMKKQWGLPDAMVDWLCHGQHAAQNDPAVGARV